METIYLKIERHDPTTNIVRHVELALDSAVLNLSQEDLKDIGYALKHAVHILRAKLDADEQAFQKTKTQTAMKKVQPMNRSIPV